MSNVNLTRRQFVRSAAGGVLAGLHLTWNPKNTLARSTPTRALRIGLCADVHKDVIHDADRRLTTFVNGMTRKNADFIMQLGDFSSPYPKNRGFLDTWNSFERPAYHVLGNHDADGGFTWEQTMAFYGMTKRYYGFDAGGCRFVVLDGNEKKKNRAPGYPRFIGPEQMAWLEAELDATDGPVFVFSHQSLHDAGGASVENFKNVQALFERTNKHAGYQKVVASIYGHRHVDHHVNINGINYICINSMSYYWVGKKFARTRFDERTEKACPWVRYTAPYRTPLYALVTIRPREGTLSIEGRKTEFISPTLSQIGCPARDGGGAAITPKIADREIEFRRTT